MTGNKMMPNVARAAGAEVGPGDKEYKDMLRKKGFTLIELLVVIAIISILAAIVTPKVQGYILKSRMTNTIVEIQGFDTALTKMLTDAGKSNFRQMFSDAPGPPADYAELETQIGQYSNAFYALLRQGKNVPLDNTGKIKNSNLTLAPGVQAKLASSYVDANLDGWDRQYRFWAGPWGQTGVIPFRCYRPGGRSADGVTYAPYKYSETDQSYDDAGQAEPRNRVQEANDLIPGNPAADEEFGYPAPRDLGMYIFSVGVNGTVDQLFGAPADDTFKGGGDDINNWDMGEQGWLGFYS